MSDYYDIKKLCSLSRIEIDESKIQQTSEKIKEIISFFNKLDEFELNEKDDNNAFENLPQSITTFTTATTTASSDKETEIDNYIKFEKKMDDLRNDEHNNKLIFFKDNNTNDKSTNNTSKFRFKFHNKKNGYVVGPRI
jgi:Asp-tRNA(Asn)/Glu-tRNA(Gln) amidotransferase C subunit